MRFNRLPREIQFDIFGSLPAQILCTKVAPVCRHWRLYAYEPILWTHVVLDGKKQSNIQMISILERSFRIRHLELHNMQCFKWIENVPNRTSLRELTVYGCIQKPTKETISQLTKIFPYVQEYYGPTVSPTNECLVPQIVNWKYLNKMTNSSDKIVHLDLITEKCLNLTHIWIRNLINVAESSFVNFIKIRGPQLEGLVIGGTLSHFSSDAFLPLSHCRRLTFLKLQNAINFTAVNFFHLRTLKNLNYLHIFASDQLFSPQFPAICSEICFPSIEMLYISCCANLNFEVLDSLVKSCPSLRRLFTAQLDSLMLFDMCSLLALKYKMRLSVGGNTILLNML